MKLITKLFSAIHKIEAARRDRLLRSTLQWRSNHYVKIAPQSITTRLWRINSTLPEKSHLVVPLQPRFPRNRDRYFWPYDTPHPAFLHTDRDGIRRSRWGKVVWIGNRSHPPVVKSKLWDQFGLGERQVVSILIRFNEITKTATVPLVVIWKDIITIQNKIQKTKLFLTLLDWVLMQIRRCGQRDATLLVPRRRINGRTTI